MLGLIILFLGGWLYLDYLNNPFMQASIDVIFQVYGILLGTLVGLAVVGSTYMLLFYAKDARNRYRILLAIQATVTLFLVSWLYVEYRDNIFLQIYLSNFLKTNGVLVGLGVGLAIALPLYLFTGGFRRTLPPRRRGGKNGIVVEYPEDTGKLKDRLRSAEEEIKTLQFRLASLTRTNFLVWGGSLLFLGSILLIGAFFTRYLLLEVSSILVILGGVALLFKDVERRLSSKVSVGIAKTPLVAYGDFLRNALGGERRAQYMPSKDGDPALIVTQDRAGNDSSSPSRVGPEVCITGQGLFRIISGELNFREKDPDYLEEWLPRVLVESLGLAASVDMSIKGDWITVALKDMSLHDFCQDEEVSKLCDWIGCPVNSAIGAVLTKYLGSGLVPLGCEYDRDMRTTKLTYRRETKARTSTDIQVAAKPSIARR